MTDINDSMKAARKRWAESGLAHALRLTLSRVPRRTGKTAREVENHSGLRQAEDGFILHPGTFYGHIWETTGRKASTSRPRARLKDAANRKAVLKFMVGGKIVFARSARIPAARPRPFIAPALQESEAFLLQSAEEETTRAINEAQPDRIIRISA